MNWRNPKNELPKDNEVVWCMLYPHKNRGDLLESAPSIQIVAGWVRSYNESCWVVNNDELGLGGISWNLNHTCEDFDVDVLGWLPVTEMIFPDWTKNE